MSLWTGCYQPKESAATPPEAAAIAPAIEPHCLNDTPVYQATLRRTEEAVKAMNALAPVAPVLPASAQKLGLPHDCASRVVVEEFTPEEGTIAPARIEPAAPPTRENLAMLQRQEQFVRTWNSMKQTGSPEEREAARERLKESMLGEPR